MTAAKTRNRPPARTSPDNAAAFRLAASLTREPLVWSRSRPAACDQETVAFVMFRAFVRALRQYRSIVQLLKVGAWEDALILVRSLYELNVNLSELHAARHPDEKAGTFIAFGKLQQLRLLQARLKDELRDAKSDSAAAAEAIAARERELAALDARLERDFAQFRTKKGKPKWQEAWSGLDAATLAARLAHQTGAKKGQHDYFVFRLGSLFTHNAPGALIFCLPPDAQLPDWKVFGAQLDKAGSEGLRSFLFEASLCLIDILGIAGPFIDGYRPGWFDKIARPILDKF
jgi:hypothetical protein